MNSTILKACRSLSPATLRSCSTPSWLVHGSPEEVIERALEQLADNDRTISSRRKTPAEAVADIRELRKGVTLGGLKITDLIGEGRKH